MPTGGSSILAGIAIPAIFRSKTRRNRTHRKAKVNKTRRVRVHRRKRR